MMTRFRTTLAALVAALLFALAVPAPPAHAANQLLHFKFSRALSATQLDSVLVTLGTATMDTTQNFLTDDLRSNAWADTAGRDPVLGGVGVNHNLALVVEVTGALQSQDSIYVWTQGSQGTLGAAAAITPVMAGGDNNPQNWRWYTLQTATGVVVNNTGSQTFIFPIPCDASNPNSWLWARQLRWIVQGDASASARGFSTRASLVWRAQ